MAESELTEVQKLAEYNADKLVGGYKAIEEACDVLTAEYKAQIKPLEEKMQEIIGALGIKLAASGQENFKTAYGTYYESTIKKIKNVDRDAFHRWVRDNDAWDCLTAHVAKEEAVTRLEALRETARQEAIAAGELARYDQEEINIPGLEVSDYTSGHIRKA